MEVTHQDDLGNEIVDFATHDPAREEQNKINARNSKLIFNVEFIPYYIKVQKEHKLTELETKIYGFVKFFTGGGLDFFVSNSTIAANLDCHEVSASKAIKTLAEKGLIQATHKITPTGTVRKLRICENKGVSLGAKGGKPVGQGGLAPRLRGVSLEAKLYKPSNTEQVIHISPKGEGDSPEVEKKDVFGDEKINALLGWLKSGLHLDDFANTQFDQRIFAKHLIGLISKIGRVEFSRRLDALTKDGFKSKRINDIKFIYYEVKAFRGVQVSTPSF